MQWRSNNPMKSEPITLVRRDAIHRWIAQTLAGRIGHLPSSIAVDIQRLGLPSRHWQVFRLPDGLLIWFECWCNNDRARAAAREWAEYAVSHGYRCAFLHSNLSYRWPKERRPLLVAPPSSEVDFDNVARRLMSNISSLQQSVENV